ncbi:MAG TPA: peptide deformylase, partial [Bacillota bacterium]|nr:peptide deformylase [Bacillota bacterium]
MALRRIVTLNNSILREKAQPVAKINSAIVRLLDDMVETMIEAKGVGLAAPQIGLSKQLIVVDAGDNHYLQLVNPCIVERTGSCLDVEGCLSIPGIYGEVDRAAKVVVTALDKDGKEVRLAAEGFLARILQHEIDHL